MLFHVEFEEPRSDRIYHDLLDTVPPENAGRVRVYVSSNGRRPGITLQEAARTLNRVAKYVKTLFIDNYSGGFLLTDLGDVVATCPGITISGSPFWGIAPDNDVLDLRSKASRPAAQHERARG